MKATNYETAPTTMEVRTNKTEPVTIDGSLTRKKVVPPWKSEVMTWHPATV